MRLSMEGVAPGRSSEPGYVSLLWRDVVMISTKLLDGKTVVFY